MTNYVAVLGTYRCGSSLVASMLDALGVDMGAPYYSDYFEPADLSTSLRRWWNEPQLVTNEPTSSRVYQLRQWAETRATKPWVGAKHPLLSLSSQDLLRAWGPGTKFIWCNRPLDESIASLERLDWWPQAEVIQTTLFKAVASFFPRENGLIVNFSDTLERTDWVVKRLVEFLNIEVTGEQFARAVSLVQRKPSEHRQAPTSVVASGTSAQANSSSEPENSVGIVGTMLCGNSEDVVGPAVKSVIDVVDKLLLIDTGISDKSLNIVESLAKEKLVVRKFKWCDDFSMARNFALEASRELNARWALTIDTDERLELSGISSLAELCDILDAAESAQAWMVEAKSGNYQKERFIRLPTSLCWQGRTHEALCGASADGRPLLKHAVFWEEPKSQASFQFKLNRDLKILREELAVNPEAGRTWYYLGQTLYGLGQTEGAIAAFDRCATIRAWDVLSAWACYSAAKCLADSCRFDEAIERCAIGLAIDPLYPELAWMAAWCHLQLNMPRRAVAWANMSSSLGAVANRSALYDRIGFRDLVGWYEGPFEVMCVAYEKLGSTHELKIAQHNLEMARQLRARRSECPKSDKS